VKKEEVSRAAVTSIGLPRIKSGGAVGRLIASLRIASPLLRKRSPAIGAISLSCAAYLVQYARLAT
jgi:hypothetical protein